ncbi:Crp/Fnr family transcriptional regulator [Hyphomicrobium sp. LHD-15]|uniref:Crp/Fnr family transcriptional regulator n=1 Tax=Hyphomicrobium sp. LHD-15 TaxID=3072142 RepID=UPI00280DA4BF|nr:Crp/Fnr family transcriptional regulator [Hyphomicrobium sp. LHD-15]MDQ8698267.1 Crp/Fnr family transcriptional regulator [Hyphomicrobium sp. LHD-15]
MDPADWDIVKSTPLFGAMPLQTAQVLVGNTMPRQYEKGATLFLQGEPAAAFFIVLDGWVKIYRTTPDGLEVVLHVFTRGETFAEAAIFLGGRYPASGETVAASRLLRVEGTAFRSRIEERPALAMSMLASASYQLKFLVEQIEQIKVRSAPQRIADFMVRLTQVRKGTAVIELPFEKGLLANRLGMKPESFSRALAHLRAHGVTVERGTVNIADIGRLLSFVEYAPEDEA